MQNDKKPKITVVGIATAGCKLVDNLANEDTQTPSIYHKLIAVDEGHSSRKLDAIKNEDVYKVLVRDKKLCSSEELQKKLVYDSELKSKFREGDKLYMCKSSKSSWAHLAGSLWIQLERDEEVIYTRTIGMSQMFLRWIKNNKIMVVFTVRDKLIRVISAREMTKKEKNFYENNKNNPYV